MFPKPAIIMPAALTQPIEIGGEADEWNKQDIGNKRFCITVWLQDTEWARYKVGVPVRIAVTTKCHRGIPCGKMRQGDGVPGVMEVSGIPAGWRFGWASVVKSDYRFFRNVPEQWCRRAMEQQCADHIGLSSDVVAPRVA